ncbi:hypothetical protein ACOT81_12895 [Streptomyces sp. WI04-05B]|nr:MULTISPECIES: hypothetical protein [unclassified Streptomyces]MDX2545341.1 hypothetical protein [Streptomyces sp. WI04-05B]MDX2588164.1 hypothetical protein [Streptomyces sp. WI04-05A]MDX3749075.1 hypothetical protein [Streptomyces sp. AK08-02]
MPISHSTPPATALELEAVARDRAGRTGITMPLEKFQELTGEA